MSILALFICFFYLPLFGVSGFPHPLVAPDSRSITPSLFEELEELSRIVDISYCVGSTGIEKPFRCLSRCSDFEGFELVTTWNTGPLLSDSCGYVAISHPPFNKRIILAFRGTYSIANTIVDLSTNPAEYAPFPGDGNEDDSQVCANSKSSPPLLDTFSSLFKGQKALTKRDGDSHEPECKNCTVHAGFLTSWTNTRCLLIPHIEHLRSKYPDYKLTLVGHSLGGAVAALASLEFQAHGWDPHVTTFGEPRIGNKALNDFLDARFNISDSSITRSSKYRRVTHVNDPVPLLPLEEWGYHMHAGEIFISKPDLSPSTSDLSHCVGDEDPKCIAAEDPSTDDVAIFADAMKNVTDWDVLSSTDDWIKEQGLWPISPRYRLWELFFAHRDYFWRLGMCVPGEDPKDWWRKYPTEGTLLLAEETRKDL
ncbi:MAG: hypothetical protein Q9227_008278 [Pyrenula ochraceoflavens]